MRHEEPGSGNERRNTRNAKHETSCETWCFSLYLRVYPYHLNCTVVICILRSKHALTVYLWSQRIRKLGCFPSTWSRKAPWPCLALFCFVCVTWSPVDFSTREPPFLVVLVRVLATVILKSKKISSGVHKSCLCRWT